MVFILSLRSLSKTHNFNVSSTMLQDLTPTHDCNPKLELFTYFEQY